MSEAKYTPGPWQWRSIAKNPRSANGQYLHNQRLCGTPPALRVGMIDVVRVADADLIAAAPCLLAAVVALLDCAPYEATTDGCECKENGTGFGDDGEPCAHILAHRAVAKATATA